MPAAVLPNQGLINVAVQSVDFLPGVNYQEVLLLQNRSPLTGESISSFPGLVKPHFFSQRVHLLPKTNILNVDLFHIL